jgi:hypothetical protein
MTPALRDLLSARACVEEMPDDPELVSVLFHLDQAIGGVKRFESRHAKTDPAPPPASERSEQPTIPDGAE